ncbi:MAG: Na/Pi symporter [Candidatus Alcyoniella australis]|nr:Na/Pi symporter [Candidatus Alcyoniella australis]
MAEEPRWKKYLRVLFFLFVLYLFFISIESMGGALKLFGRGFAESLMQATTNPFVGLLMGLLATSIIQSSSSTTSIIVGMVACGSLTLEGAIPMVMGANIGTSVTAVLVSLGHITRKAEFRRAFIGATMHDMFNIMAVIIVLPLEISTHFLARSSMFIALTLEGAGGLKFVSPLKLIVSPVVKLARELFVWIGGESTTTAAVLMLIFALLLLFLSLKLMVGTMKKLIFGRVESIMHDYLFKSTLRALVIGAAITALIQSSSITTSLVVPLMGAGILSLEAVFPFTVGANIGTTVTALLASLVTGQATPLAVALSHLLFNICGAVVFVPLRRIPIGVAKLLGRLVDKGRIFAFLYVLLVFFVIPIACILIFD